MVHEDNAPRFKGDSKRISLFMDFAQRVAEESYCVRKKVGCIIVDSMLENVLAIGYNGTISGFPNVCELNDGTTNSEIVLHAETNALSKLTKSGTSSVGATLLTTLSPCVDCAKLIIQSGIRKVIYRDEYHNTKGIELLKQANIYTLNFKNK